MERRGTKAGSGVGAWLIEIRLKRGIAFGLGAAGDTPPYCRRDGGATFEIPWPLRL
jgi:hypothetical protein